MKLRMIANCSALMLAGAFVVGCGGENAAHPDVDGSALVGSNALYSCATETRAVAYTANLSRMSGSGLSTAILVKSDPAPTTKGPKDWTLKILDASGAPETGLTLKVSPFMPDHGHGPSKNEEPVVTPVSGQAGTYLASPVYLFMEGYWEVTVTWQPATGAQESVVFPICVSG
ncbi:MAG TPA: FixH family protein [Polyangia bacterium]|jgi:hypothetical protein|nr:FixH family protein [Polyangia bacterium]